MVVEYFYPNTVAAKGDKDFIFSLPVGTRCWVTVFKNKVLTVQQDYTTGMLRVRKDNILYYHIDKVMLDNYAIIYEVETKTIFITKIYKKVSVI